LYGSETQKHKHQVGTACYNDIVTTIFVLSYTGPAHLVGITFKDFQIFQRR